MHFRLPALFLMLAAGKSALDSGNLFLAVEPSACRDIFRYRDRSPHERKDGFANHFATLGIALDPPPILVARFGDRGSKRQIVALRAGLVILSKRCASKSLLNLSITRRRGTV
ncbi:MAG TPA: hypothetical protein VHR44_18175, partial [Beijerinckiaceae bacterium]|nr:hypothetical protein [Beijerinckiaceae bacterium]